MGQRELRTLEDSMRGPIIHFDKEDGMGLNHLSDAIDLHIIPPLVIAHSQLCEMNCGETMDRSDRETVSGYLAIMRNAIIMLTRIAEEAQEDYARRHNL